MGDTTVDLHVHEWPRQGGAPERPIFGGYRRGGITFPGVSCTELQSLHLNIFNSGFLHRRDFRMKPGATETDF